MSQRGGAVVSHLRISDKPIWSDLIPAGSADIILSVEPLEALRYLPYLKKDGYIVTNITKFDNMAVYPEVDREYEKIGHKIRVIRIDADQIARESGNYKASNMVMVGAASPFIEIPEEDIMLGIREIFQAKGEKIVSSNINAFLAGKKFTKEHM
jgi:indolepyruvate ferredoxin oxidoreductase beta subunit